MSRRVVAAVAAAVALALAGCGDGEDRPGEVTAEGGGSGTGTGSGTGSASGTHADHGAGTPTFAEGDADTVAHVTMRDFEFSGLPASVKGPKVYFEVTNEGPGEHELVVLRDGEELGEVHLEKVGDEGVLTLEMEPGSYTVECHIERDDGKTHDQLGMKANLTVT